MVLSINCWAFLGNILLGFLVEDPFETTLPFLTWNSYLSLNLYGYRILAFDRQVTGLSPTDGVCRL